MSILVSPFFFSVNSAQFYINLMFWYFLGALLQLHKRHMLPDSRFILLTMPAQHNALWRGMGIVSYKRRKKNTNTKMPFLKQKCNLQGQVASCNPKKLTYEVTALHVYASMSPCVLKPMFIFYFYFIWVPIVCLASCPNFRF